MFKVCVCGIGHNARSFAWILLAIGANPSQDPYLAWFTDEGGVESICNFNRYTEVGSFPCKPFITSKRPCVLPSPNSNALAVAMGALEFPLFRSGRVAYDSVIRSR